MDKIKINMAAKIFRINYKSDFILTLNSDAGWMTPFCIKFWTGAPSQAYYVGWDGETYNHCSFDPSEPTKLQVQFDDHHLPIGDLKFQIGYHFTVADFPNDTEDEVINQASVIIEQDGEPAQVMLDFNGETAPEIQFSLPAYANEAQRIANEEQRIANEEQRILNEQTRIQNEEARISQEQTRQRNEQQRVNQEQARVQEYAQLKADAVAATGAANDAATLANQKAQLANDKAALAYAAATLANQKAQLAADKAALAQQKAEYANTQGTYAKNQGDYAKTEGDYAKAQGDYAKDQGDYAKAQGDTALADHERAERDHQTASDDHTLAVSDHQTASDDHTLAVSDHQTASDDHALTVSDHQTASDDHTLAVADHQQAGEDHTASVAATEAANQAAAGANALQENLEDGTVIPKLATNLKNWEDRDELSVEDEWTGQVRTTAGDQSINSDAGARLIAITPLTDFYADSLKTTGFNLLRNAVAVGDGYYFLVPKLPFGTYGTANEPNGVLFTNSNHENLTPTVRFKALTEGVPTSVSDGDVCAYTDSHGYRFYTTSEAGYIIVSGITLASTCAHIGWSRRYDEYMDVDAAGDAGSTIALTNIIHAVHDFDLLLTATRNLQTVQDGLTFGDSQATWTRRVNRIQPTWTNTETEEGSGLYVHEATIDDMKEGGIAECGDIELLVNGNVISYTDANTTATEAWVKYELATAVTGTVSISNALTVEDWGLEMLVGATGEAEVTTQYAQGYPDAVANLVNGGYQQRTQELEAQIAVLKAELEGLGAQAEGYIRVSGSSNPALNYKHYSKGNPGGFTQESVSQLFYPCLIGTPLSGDATQIGKVLVVLDKFGAVTDNGVAKWKDLNGDLHLIDGSEGDVMITNIKPYHAIFGKYTINGTAFDVFLTNPTSFTWEGIESEEIPMGASSPDFCVSHKDSDNVNRMHSVYNPDWAGSYTAPNSVVGKYIYSQDAETGEITEEYDSEATLLGGSGGLHTTDLDLPTGEQRAMNMNADTTKTVPFMNATAHDAELFMANLLAEGGTWDAHNANRMGSGFSSNEGAVAADWEESASGAKNGMRVMDKNGAWKYYALSTNIASWTGKSSSFRSGQIINSWRNPFHIMEAQRAISYAVQNGVGELQWFVFEGNKYKWRSVAGFDGPAQGEMTCVLWKVLSSKAASNVKDPTDRTTSIEGNRMELLISVALFHGRTTQVSPGWWTSGLLFTEDDSGQYEAYMQRDQSLLLKSNAANNYDPATPQEFETAYLHVGTYQSGSSYRKNYSKEAFMLPDTNANRSGGSLHTYVCGYNAFNGAASSEGKRSVRGFLRGSYAVSAYMSPLFVVAYLAPSNSLAYLGFGTCCRIAES